MPAKLITQVAFLCFLFFAASVWSADYYVSPNGSDSNDGLSEAAPWKSLAKVNSFKFQPGDFVRFQCGGLWRIPAYGSSLGSMLNSSCSGEPGKPITFTSYGKGEKPIFCGSISASEEKDWVQVSPNVWGTREVERTLGKKLNVGLADWSLHYENGAKSSIKSEKQTDGTVLLTVRTKETGTAPNHIQLWGKGVDREALTDMFVLRFRARASKPFQMDQFSVMQSGFPYAAQCVSAGKSYAVTEDWQEFEAVLRTLPKELDGTLCWHLNLGKMPADTEIQIQLFEAKELNLEDSLCFPTDVGNIIFDHGNFTKYHRCGIKKWKLEDLKAPGDYFYQKADGRVFLYWPENPAKTCESIELAMKMHAINHGGKHDVVFDGLAVCNAASHGFGGGGCARITIRNCDIYYIGGAHQFTTESGIPVRFGNGIEFWNTAKDCLVEKNRIWEIYDAALTNQGRGNETVTSDQVNITYRENEIWNSEYSFEYWNAFGVTENILFEKNVCRDAGYGWAHGQRPDPNGGHMMFYRNRAKTKNFVVRENVFVDSTEVCLRMDTDWRDGLTLEKNIYGQTPGMKIVRFEVKNWYDTSEFEKYQKELGMDSGSQFILSKERAEKNP